MSGSVVVLCCRVYFVCMSEQSSESLPQLQVLPFKRDIAVFACAKAIRPPPCQQTLPNLRSRRCASISSPSLPTTPTSGAASPALCTPSTACCTPLHACCLCVCSLTSPIYGMTQWTPAARRTRTVLPQDAACQGFGAGSSACGGSQRPARGAARAGRHGRRGGPGAAAAAAAGAARFPGGAHQPAGLPDEEQTEARRLRSAGGLTCHVVCRVP